MRLIIRTEAEVDIVEGYDWYEQQAGLGSAFLSEIAETISAVHFEPKRFPRIHGQLRRAQVSRFPYGVFFIAGPDAVVVVAAMHLTRDPARARSRH